MIEYKGLKECLLKAVSLHKDHSKQIYVERMVDKPGMLPFTQHFWTTPDKMKDTDKVILNHHNLPKGHKQRSENVISPGSTKPIDPQIQQWVDNYFGKFYSNEECMSVLENQGITWSKTTKQGKPISEKMNLTRAKRTLGVAIHNNPDLQNKLYDPTKITPANGRNYYLALCRSIGKEYYDHVRDIIDKIPEEYKSLRTVWNNYEKDMNVKTFETSGKVGCFYLPDDTDPYINLWSLNTINEGNSDRKPWEVLFHEGGHAIDYTVDRTNVYDTYSVTYQQGKFLQAIQDDVKNLLKQHGLDDYEYKLSYGDYKGSYKYQQDKKKLTEEIQHHAKNGDDEWFEDHKMCIFDKTDTIDDFEKGADMLIYREYQANEQSDTSLRPLIESMEQKLFTDSDKIPYSTLVDVILGATNGEIMFKGVATHDRGYWKRTNKHGFTGVATEAFANLTEDIISQNTKSLEIIKTYLPQTYKTYIEMINTLANGGKSNEKSY